MIRVPQFLYFLSFIVTLQQRLRLITITGPAGVGKTSLALHVAHAAQDDFSDGIFFISLAPIRDPTLIIPTISQALSLSGSPRRLRLDSLKDMADMAYSRNTA